MNELMSQLTSQSGGLSVGSPFEFAAMIIASLLFGIILRQAYYVYYRRNEPVDVSIARSFPLIAPGVTTIFWLIQYSLPLSLGLLGALSFVRFRTPVKRAEDVAFILIVIAVSLACAVLKFWVALIVVLVVLLYSFLRNNVLPRLDKSGSAALVTLHTK